MIIVEAYILIGEQAFWSSHFASLQNIIELLVGNLSMRGVKYLNLVFEALLKVYPVKSSQMLLSSRVVITILKSCAEKFENDQNCEPVSVIHIYLSVISRIVLALQNNLGVLLGVLRNSNNFRLIELVSLRLLITWLKQNFLYSLPHTIFP